MPLARNDMVVEVCHSCWSHMPARRVSMLLLSVSYQKVQTSVKGARLGIARY